MTDIGDRNPAAAVPLPEVPLPEVPLPEVPLPEVALPSQNPDHPGQLLADETLPASTPVPRTRLTLVALGILLVLIGLNLRTLFSSFAAVEAEVMAAVSLPAPLVVVLTTLPVTLLGVFAFAAPPLARRFGVERAILGAVLLLTLGLLARGAGPVVGLLLGTLASGAGIAVVNVLLPVMVKRDFAHRIGLMSGLYTTAICASAALGAGVTHPIFDATGSWQLALVFWAVPCALALVLWIPFALRGRRIPGPTAAARPPGAPAVSVWRSATAWQLTVFMVLQSMMSFSVFAWLAPILRERGMDAVTAGFVVASSIVLQMAGSLIAPAIAARFKDQRAIAIIVAALASGGFALVILGPFGGVWVWAGILGLGQGALTAVALTMVILRSGDDTITPRLSGMMQGVGYALGSSGTLFVFLLHAATGSFAAAGFMFITIGVLASVFGYLAGRNRRVGT